MDAGRFWQIVGAADSPAALHMQLAELPDDELVGFEQLHDKAMADAYEWGLWGAAYVIEGGCSDDSFEYFRAYLVGRGRRVYEAALADPDSLADAEVENGDAWEDWMSPTMMVIHARTGEYAFADPGPRQPGPAEPRGEEWDDDDLAGRFPRVAAKYDW